ncbi:MAG: diguanylate cyclase domain-containing protein [Ruminococcus sp.]
MEEQTCWNTLNESVDEVSAEIELRVNSDQRLLASIANIIADKDIADFSDVQNIIDGFKPNTMISHIALLFPGDKLMMPGEPVRDTEGLLSFEQEASLGYHISDRSVDIRDNSRMILRNFVPIEKEGQTIAMLYGVAELQNLPEQLHITAYNDQAAIYVIDGNTGNFIADTWHDSLGNLEDLGERKVKAGYSHESLVQDVVEGNEGHCIFVSQSTGKNLYFCYKPAKINNWSVGISVSDDVAFARVKKVNGMLLSFIAFEIIILAGYFMYILSSTRKELCEKQRLAERDLLTGLLNRNSYENNISSYAMKCRESIICIYIDVNGLHELNNTKGHSAGDEMLKTVANTVRTYFDDRDVFRIGGDEFVAFVCDSDENSVKRKLEQISEYLTECGYHISIGMYKQTTPVNIDELIKEAEKLMYDDKKEYYRRKGVDRRARS